MAGKVATLAFARPDRLNALTPELLGETAAAIDAALAAGARAIVLTGEGRAFCSGADLSSDEPLPENLGVLIDHYYNPLVTKIAALDIPLVTAINGPAVGAGMALALLGDISIAARSAYFLLAFVNIGLVPDAGSTWLTAQAVGRARALEMALLGERMDAQEALEKGLITRVAEDEEVLAQAQAIARRLAEGPTIAIGMIRKQVAFALTQGLDHTLVVERANQARAGLSADFREAVASFREKRAPLFKGE